MRSSYEQNYGPSASAVLSSKNRVARAGRTHDPARIEAERERHYAFMEVVKADL